MIPNKMKDIKLVRRAKQPSLDWRIDKKTKRVNEKIDGLDSVVQSIEFILSTERYWEHTLSGEYGVEFNALLGKDFSYVRAIIGVLVEEALLADDRISSVDILEVSVFEDAINLVINALTDFGVVTIEHKISGG